MNASQSTRVIDALRDTVTYSHPVGRVDILQTHISWVVLAGERVYKVKKPVDFGFLDFSTLGKRRHYCHQEVALNSRLCPDLYIGVVAVRDDQGTIRLGGGRGRIVEYAVEMHRLPQEGMLDNLLANDAVSPESIDEVGGILARFHEKSAAGAEIARFGSTRAIQRNWDENFEQTAEFIGRTISQGQVDYLKAWVTAWLRRNRDFFKRRVIDGRVRDGHGDLRASAVWTGEHICIFDCIEFNKRFRYGDVAADVAFLAMDLAAKGRPDLAERFVDAYVAESNDSQLREVMDFYVCYRAFVRGKVESFRVVDAGVSGEQRDEAAAIARARFSQAVATARQKQPPLLLLTSGLSGSAKSALAGTLADEFEMTVIASDVVRKELAGIDPDHREPVEYGAGIYSAEFTARTYREMLRRARPLLGQGASVVLDATFSSREWRSRAAALTKDAGALMLCLECVASEAVIRTRLLRRDLGDQTHSDAGWETYLAQRDRFEPVTELTAWQHIVLDTSGALDATREAARYAVRERIEPPGLAVPQPESNAPGA